MQTDTPNFLTLGWTYRKPFETPKNLFRPRSTGPHHYDYNLENITLTQQNETGNVTVHSFDIFPAGDCHEIYMAAFDGNFPDQSHSISPILALTYCATPGAAITITQYIGPTNPVVPQENDVLYIVNPSPINNPQIPPTVVGFDEIVATAPVVADGFIVIGFGTPHPIIVPNAITVSWHYYRCNGTALVPSVNRLGWLIQGYSDTPPVIPNLHLQNGVYNPFNNTSSGSADYDDGGQPGMQLTGLPWGVVWPGDPTFTWQTIDFSFMYMPEPPFTYSWGGTSLNGNGQTYMHNSLWPSPVSLYSLEDITARWRSIPARPLP